ncbi:hypothetical protein BGZ94_006529 [Podila epigama]|nr:hypothetical protein BGZ94_006529 [Podila epigama]
MTTAPPSLPTQSTQGAVDTVDKQKQEQEQQQRQRQRQQQQQQIKQPKHPSLKPEDGLAILLSQAISESPKAQMTVGELCSWVLQRLPPESNHPLAMLQALVHHSLTHSKILTRVDPPPPSSSPSPPFQTTLSSLNMSPLPSSNQSGATAQNSSSMTSPTVPCDAEIWTLQPPQPPQPLPHNISGPLIPSKRKNSEPTLMSTTTSTSTDTSMDTSTSMAAAASSSIDNNSNSNSNSNGNGHPAAVTATKCPSSFSSPSPSSSSSLSSPPPSLASDPALDSTTPTMTTMTTTATTATARRTASVENSPSPSPDNTGEQQPRRSGRSRRPPKAKEADDYVITSYRRHTSPTTTPPTSPPPSSSTTSSTTSMTTSAAKESVQQPPIKKRASVKFDRHISIAPPTAPSFPTDCQQSCPNNNNGGRTPVSEDSPVLMTTPRVRRPPQNLAEFVSSEDFKAAPCGKRREKASSHSLVSSCSTTTTCTSSTVDTMTTQIATGSAGGGRVKAGGKGDHATKETTAIVTESSTLSGSGRGQSGAVRSEKRERKRSGKHDARTLTTATGISSSTHSVKSSRSVSPLTTSASAMTMNDTTFGSQLDRSTTLLPKEEASESTAMDTDMSLRYSNPNNNNRSSKDHGKVRTAVGRPLSIPLSALSHSKRRSEDFSGCFQHHTKGAAEAMKKRQRRSQSMSSSDQYSPFYALDQRYPPPPVQRLPFPSRQEIYEERRQYRLQRSKHRERKRRAGTVDKESSKDGMKIKVEDGGEQVKKEGEEEVDDDDDDDGTDSDFDFLKEEEENYRMRILTAKRQLALTGRLGRLYESDDEFEDEEVDEDEAHLRDLERAYYYQLHRHHHQQQQSSSGTAAYHYGSNPPQRRRRAKTFLHPQHHQYQQQHQHQHPHRQRKSHSNSVGAYDGPGHLRRLHLHEALLQKQDDHLGSRHGIFIGNENDKKDECVMALAKEEGERFQLRLDPSVITYGFDSCDGQYILDYHQSPLFNNVTWPEFSDLKDLKSLGTPCTMNGQQQSFQDPQSVGHVSVVSTDESTTTTAAATAAAGATVATNDSTAAAMTATVTATSAATSAATTCTTTVGNLRAGPVKVESPTADVNVTKDDNQGDLHNVQDDYYSLEQRERCGSIPQEDVDALEAKEWGKFMAEGGTRPSVAGNNPHMDRRLERQTSLSSLFSLLSARPSTPPETGSSMILAPAEGEEAALPVSVPTTSLPLALIPEAVTIDDPIHPTLTSTLVMATTATATATATATLTTTSSLEMMDMAMEMELAVVAAESKLLLPEEIVAKVVALSKENEEEEEDKMKKLQVTMDGVKHGETEGVLIAEGKKEMKKKTTEDEVEEEEELIGLSWCH